MWLKINLNGSISDRKMLATLITPSHLPIRRSLCPSSSSPPPSRTSLRLRASSTSDSDREEVRWVREEQRWIREETRWLREEQRWRSEREAMLLEISELKVRIEAMEMSMRSNQSQGVAETFANLSSILQVLKTEVGSFGRIGESGAGPNPIVLEKVAKEEEKEEDIIVKEIRVVESEVREVKEEKKVVKRKVLKIGAEGEEVKALQEALEKLGFYSGEEDTEFSSFSTGTERAVKTWQSSVGAPEDGIMTSELLEWLYSEQSGEAPDLSKQDAKQLGFMSQFGTQENGAAVASVAKVSEVQKKVVTEKVVAEVDYNDHRVYLLGENRWEEPSRLTGKGKKTTANEKSNIASKCIVCRGEGRVLCMDCDGTGEPNIEQQFLEWVDEEMKCPYCEGCGFTACDACEK